MATLGVAQAGLWTAQQTLSALEQSIDSVIDTAEAAVQSAQDAVNAAIEAGEAMVDGTMSALTEAVNSLLSNLCSSVSWVINLQNLYISSALNQNGQDVFNARITGAFFGGSMGTFSVQINLNDLTSMIGQMIASAAVDLGNWLVAELSGTPAAEFANWIYNALVTAADGEGTLSTNGIGSTVGNNIFYAGQTLQSSAGGMSNIVSPNGAFTFTLTTSGNLELTNQNGDVIWQSGSQGTCNCQAFIDQTGNFQVLDVNNVMLWQSNTLGGILLQVEDSGTIFMLFQNSSIVWSANQVDQSFLVQPGTVGPQSLSYDEYLLNWKETSTDGSYVYTVSYGDAVLWTSDVFQGAEPFAWFNGGNGNIAIIDSTGNSVWTSSTSTCTTNCYFGLSSDGALLITDVTMTQQYLVIYAGSPCNSNNGGCSTDATCSFNGATVTCTCNSGFTGDGYTCQQNPCDTNNGGCSPDATCTSNGVTVSCTCNAPYFGGDGYTCVFSKGSSCSTDLAGCGLVGQECMQFPFGANCYCPNGGTSCTPVMCQGNPSLNTHYCPSNWMYVNCGGIPTCCQWSETDGYLNCQQQDQPNPCLTNNGGCSGDATCTYSAFGVATCTCNEFYTGDGKTCTFEVGPSCSYNFAGCDTQNSVCAALSTGLSECMCPPGRALSSCPSTNACIPNDTLNTKYCPSNWLYADCFGVINCCLVNEWGYYNCYPYQDV